MRKKDFKGRCEKRSLSKCVGVCKTYDISIFPIGMRIACFSIMKIHTFQSIWRTQAEPLMWNAIRKWLTIANSVWFITIKTIFPQGVKTASVIYSIINPKAEQQSHTTML